MTCRVPVRFVSAALTVLLSGLAVRSLPAQDMPLTQVLLPGEGWALLGEGYGFTEGPAVDRDGNVYFSDIPNHRIHRIDLDGKITVFAEQTASTNGLMFGPDGRLYGCRDGEKKIVAYKPDGTFEEIAEAQSSNDIVVTSKGGIYVTDRPNESVVFVAPDRTKKVVASGFLPNGVILTPDEGTLVVTDSRAPHLWAFRVEPDGSLKFKDRYYGPLQTPVGRDTAGSDGMTVDKDGHLYVATHLGIQMFDPTGRLGGTIAKPQNKFLANVVFGGPKFEYLYATCSDKVYRRRTKTAGAPYFLRAAAGPTATGTK